MASNPSDIELPKLSLGNQLLFLAAFHFGLGLAAAIVAVKHVVLVTSLSWIFSFIFSFFFNPAKLHLTLTIQLFYLYRSDYVRQFLQALKRFVARNGSDEDTSTTFLWSGITLFSYVSTVSTLHNLKSIFMLFWAWLPSVGSVATVLLLTVTYADRQTMLDGSIKAIHLMQKLKPKFIKLAQYTGSGVVKLYNWLGFMFKSFYRLKVKVFGHARPEYWGEPFSYSNLNADTEIRLLKVSRRGAFSDYTCDIIHVPISDGLEYEAISYTWGNQPIDQDLIVGGRILKVSSVVLEIIQGRASFLDEKLLWIDGVCINQADLAEKTAQIRRMRDIYKNADRVIAWLGTAPDANACMGYLAHLSRRLMSPLTDAEWKGLLGIGSSDKAFHAFFTFLGHPYWTRAWICQEITVSDKVIVSYGGEYVSWTYLEKIISPLFQRMQVDNPFAVTAKQVTTGFLDINGLIRVNLVGHIRTMYRDPNNTLTLDHLVRMTNHCSATDPRDKIYSMLGLVPSLNEPSLEPDYTKSMGDLCADFTKFVMKAEPLVSLSTAGLGWSRQTTGLPSWSPDYAITNLMAPISTGKLFPPEVTNHPAGDSEVFYHTHPTLPILSIRFLAFDEISELGPEFFYPDPTIDVEKDLVRLATLSLEYQEFATTRLKSSVYRHTGETRHEATWRTRMGNRNIRTRPYARPAPPEYETYYHHHLERMQWILKEVEKETNQAAGDVDKSSAPSAVPERFDPFSLETKGEGQWAQASTSLGQGRRAAITRDGALTMVPKGTVVGDIVGVMQGGESCIVLRKESKLFSVASPPIPKHAQSSSDTSSRQSGNTHTDIQADWRFVGECYVHGFMDGEALSLGSFEEANIW